MIAQAQLEAAAKEAEAQKKRAEGTQAEQAAEGLAAAKVQEAKADALEKEGVAEANVLSAKAKAHETQGMAEARVAEEKLTAEARGKEQVGMAQAKVTEEQLSAEAKGAEEVGMAEARVAKEKALADAAGLVEKFAAMNNMSPEAREFEEFKMNLEAHLKETLTHIAANENIAKDQAEVISAALENANIDIVGGGSGGSNDYFDKLAKGLGTGNALNGFLEKSPVVQALLEKFLAGKGDDKGDNKDV